MLKQTFTYLLIVLTFLTCHNPNNETVSQSTTNSDIVCTVGSCEGIYSGPEFLNGSDIAHQFSNEMCLVVGDKLKDFYKNSKYSRVDFSKIKMSTDGMGTGTVVYKIVIPFETVKEKCAAYTSFDHVGGWNHTPALSARKAQLERVVIKGESLYVSELKRTAEGLQEYWIQWKDKELQAECGK